MTCVTCRRPFGFDADVSSLRYDWIERGLAIEYFHAADDKQAVRDTVFEIIRSNLPYIRVDSVIVQKNKTHPSLRDEASFYSRMIGYLLRYVFDSIGEAQCDEIIVMTDRIPVLKKRRAVEKAVKMTLHDMALPTHAYRLMHYDSKSSSGLQVADYCNWAIYRWWAQKDDRSRSIIRPAIRSEFDIFKSGQTNWY